MSKPTAEIRLQGKELESMRTQHATAKQALLVIGQRTVELLGIRPKIKAVLLIHNNDKMLIFDDGGKLVGVEEDPPGVCREPTGDEKERWDGAGL
jgi:hypothetical protein